MLQKCKSFVGVFASMEDSGNGFTVCFVRYPHNCQLVEFIVGMILGNHYCIIEFLDRNVFYLAH